MAEKEKLNTILIISGVSFTIIFLLLISLLNLWIKLSVDKDRSVKITTPIEAPQITKSVSKERKPIILKREAAEQTMQTETPTPQTKVKTTEIETQQRETKVERELPVQTDFLIN